MPLFMRHRHSRQIRRYLFTACPETFTHYVLALQLNYVVHFLNTCLISVSILDVSQDPYGIGNLLQEKHQTS